MIGSKNILTFPNILLPTFWQLPTFWHCRCAAGMPGKPTSCNIPLERKGIMEQFDEQIIANGPFFGTYGCFSKYVYDVIILINNVTMPIIVEMSWYPPNTYFDQIGVS